MATIIALPTAAPPGETLAERRHELAVLLVAIDKLSRLSDDGDGLTLRTIARLNQLATRLQGELNRMLANAIKAGDVTLRAGN